MTLAKKYFYLITALFAFIIYMFTLAPSVVQIDSGELAAVQATLGIAHPTGYPLFTMIGYLFSMIPLPFSIIFQLNILAAIYCSAAVGVFTYTIKYCLDNISFFKNEASEKKLSKKEKKKNKEQSSNEKQIDIPEHLKFLTAVFGGLILAFSRTFWFQSTSVEVYSLHLLLITLILLFLLKAYIISFENDKLSNWLMFAFFLALGFTNHLTTLMILPGTAYLYFTRYKFNSASIKKLALMILLFSAVLVAVYSYLPIRASQNPILNWGNPTDWEKIYRQVTGKQYQVWLFSSFDSAGKQFSHFWNILPLEFFIGLIPVVVGLFFSLFKSKKLGVFILITFAFTVLYSINYDIHDIDSYFLLAFVMLAFFAAFGALEILEMKNLTKNYGMIGLGIVLIIQLFFNFIKVNQSGVYTFEDYTKAVLNTVPQNSIILSKQWDYFISESYYYQFVENYRRNITIVDKELLRNRPWYYLQLHNIDPKLFIKFKQEADKFNKELIPFDEGKQYNGMLLGSLYNTVMSKLITTNIDQRDFFIGPELVDEEMKRGEFTLPKGYTLVPHLLSYQVVKGNEYVPAPDPDFTIRILEDKNNYIDFIENMVGRMLSERAFYEVQHGKTVRAKIYLNKIRNDLPGFRLHPALLDVLQN